MATSGERMEVPEERAWSQIQGSKDENSPFAVLELRKEKSRDAARSRRGKENYEFYELAKMLPLPGAITSQLDKASIVRLTISYLKLRDFSSHGDPPWNREGPPPNKSVKGGRRLSGRAVAMQLFETHQGSHILQSLDGFTFSLNNDGRFLYISETVSIYLGLSQVEMAGCSIFDYTHQQDHAELADQLGITIPQGGAMSLPSPGGASDDSFSGGSSSTSQRTPKSPTMEKCGSMAPDLVRGYDRCFCIRMKSTLTKRGMHIKASGYRVIQILAHFRPQYSFTLQRKASNQLIGVVGLGLALPPPSIHELRLEPDSFVLKLNPTFCINYCDSRVEELFDLSVNDLMSSNLYEHCYAEDLLLLRKAHIDLIAKGQVMTDYFRLLGSHGGFVWVQMSASVLFNSKSPEAQTHIVAIISILSDVVLPEVVMDSSQMQSTPKSDPDISEHSTDESTSEHEDGSKERHDEIVGDSMPSGHFEKHSQNSSQITEKSSQSLLDENLNLTEVNSKNRSLCKRKLSQALDRNEFDCDEPESNCQIVVTTGDVHDKHLVEESPPRGDHSPQAPVDLSTSTLVPTTTEQEVIEHRKTTSWYRDIDMDGKSDTGASISSVSGDLERLIEKQSTNTNLDSFGCEKLCTPRSAIQWAGAPPTSMPNYAASNLLKQLYVNRESVIRSNVFNPRSPYYSLDVSMLSPTTGEGNSITNIQPVTIPSTESFSPSATISSAEKMQLMITEQDLFETDSRSYGSSSYKPTIYPPPAHVHAQPYNLPEIFYQSSAHYPVTSAFTASQTSQCKESSKNGTSWFSS